MRIFVILLVFPFIQGCVAFGYPSMSQTPSIEVGEPDVKAFRIKTRYIWYGWLSGPIKTVSELGEISPKRELFRLNITPSGAAIIASFQFMSGLAFGLLTFDSTGADLRL